MLYFAIYKVILCVCYACFVISFALIEFYSTEVLMIELNLFTGNNYSTKKKNKKNENEIFQ